MLALFPQYRKHKTFGTQIVNLWYLLTTKDKETDFSIKENGTFKLFAGSAGKEWEVSELKLHRIKKYFDDLDENINVVTFNYKKMKESDLPKVIKTNLEKRDVYDLLHMKLDSDIVDDKKKQSFRGNDNAKIEELYFSMFHEDLKELTEINNVKAITSKGKSLVNVKNIHAICKCYFHSISIINTTSKVTDSTSTSDEETL